MKTYNNLVKESQKLFKEAQKIRRKERTIVEKRVKELCQKSNNYEEKIILQIDKLCKKFDIPRPWD